MFLCELTLRKWECRALWEPVAPLTTNTHTYQPLVPGINDCIEHGLIEEAVAHPLRYDDVYSLHGQVHLLHLPLDDGHNWRHKKRSGGTSQRSLPDRVSEIFYFVSPHDWIVFTHHHRACWPWQFSQRSLRCCCTQSIKTKNIWTHTSSVIRKSIPLVKPFQLVMQLLSQPHKWMRCDIVQNLPL